MVLSDEAILYIQNTLIESGCPVTTSVEYVNMGNFESVDCFLTECMEGKSGSVVMYDVNYDGSIGRMKFIFDGTDMYVVSARGMWNDSGRPIMSNISYGRVLVALIMHQLSLEPLCQKLRILKKMEMGR